jgi:hypothetical protein
MQGVLRLGAIALVVAVAVTTTASMPTVHPSPAAYHIPAFARKYRTSCSTCHTAAPKLNVLGEAFRLNGYRFPENDALLRKDDAIPLGAEEWRDLWPRAIPPGELPDAVPLALRVINDVQFTNAPSGESSVNLRLPEEIYLLGAAAFDETFSAFLEMEWKRDAGVELLQAKVKIQDLLPWLPPRSLNAWVGLQNPYLFTFADRQIDRAARQKFAWQEFRLADIEVENTQTGELARSTNTFRLGQTLAAIEVNGLLSGRLGYGVGIAQGAGEGPTDNNDRKDVYYRVRYKLGGLGLDGLYGANVPSKIGRGGQLYDKALLLEHFGYFGAEPADGGVQDDHRSLGVNARALLGPLDAGVGYVWSRNDNPWGTSIDGAVTTWSVFGKGEYLVYPWLIASFKLDVFETRLPSSAAVIGAGNEEISESRILPGVVMLLRQNLRGVVEAELYTSYSPRGSTPRPTPNSLWLRLDLAF